MLDQQDPVAQVAAFGGREIGYDETVLTPRAWTQEQSGWGRSLLDELPEGRVLEVCSGAGHIGLLAVVGTDRELVQVDASIHACAWALRNARAWGIASEIRHGSMLDALEPDERFALVIADPPYVPSHGVAQYPEDPVTAIDGGDDGLDLARMCLDVMTRHLARDGVGLLQLRDLQQGEQLRVEAKERGLSIDEGRQFDGGAVVLLRRSTEGTP
ncbi:methyltransferase [Aeromicrobium sp.]|uniref:methyltransferase n=1 Tax=Aeromicrobium sp. TaxID=1871063 RepID=UPI0028B1F1AC|nr:methyltransferase [Aeromicrobium sp.]